jgi:hypothetical protein
MKNRIIVILKSILPLEIKNRNGFRGKRITGFQYTRRVKMCQSDIGGKRALRVTMGNLQSSGWRGNGRPPKSTENLP